MKGRILLITTTLFIYFLGINYRLYAQEVHANKKKPPNIIFLLTDDQRFDAMGAMGNKIIKTPNMDSMAKEGILFKRAYVTTAICAVSRASILSGQYARRTGIWNFHTFFSDSALAMTYPMILHRHGYYTGFIGKWGIGDSGKKNRIAGTDKTLSGKEIMDSIRKRFDYWKAWQGQGDYMVKLPNGKEKHSTLIVDEEAKAFLNNVPKDKPFCLSISFKAPHVQDAVRSFIPESGLEDLYKDVTIPKVQTDNLKYFKMLPEIIKNSLSRVRWIETFHNDSNAINNYGQYLTGKPLKRWSAYNYKHKGQHHSYEEAVKNYYRLVTGVDIVIGHIRKQLEQKGIANNTIIILMGDNGMLLGDHGLIGKWLGYNASARVPMVIYDPLVADSARGQIRNDIALNIDIAPTILDIAGIKIPKQMQGRSLVPLLEGGYPQWRNDFLYEHLFHTNSFAIPMSQGVISKHYVYLQYLNNDYKPMYEQLFDLKRDPHEVYNFAGDSGYFKILEIMRNRMHSLIREKK